MRKKPEFAEDAAPRCALRAFVLAPLVALLLFLQRRLALLKLALKPATPREGRLEMDWLFDPPSRPSPRMLLARASQTSAGAGAHA